MEPEHHDPFSESGRSGLEKLMAIGVLTEASSRMAAERARSRAASEERAAEREQAAQDAAAKTQRLALAEESRRARQWRALAANPNRMAGHLRGLPVQEVARHWRQAAAHADGDRTANTVLAAAEGELRGRMPTLMNAYDHARRDGAAPPQAMYAAAQQVFGGARPHGAARHAAGALPVLDQELEQQLRRSAGALGPVERGRWLRSLEERGWSPDSIAWAEAMLVRWDDQRRTAAAAAAATATADDPDTTHNERADGLQDAAAATARADNHARDATAVAGTAGRPAPPPSSTPASSTLAAPAARHGTHQQVGGPARLARASFATPASAVLRPAVPPSTGGSGQAAPEHTSRRGRTR
jgi:hypothetical protein